MDTTAPTHLRLYEVVVLLACFFVCLCIGRACSRSCLRNQRFSLMDDVDLSKLSARYKVRAWGDKDGFGEYRPVKH